MRERVFWLKRPLSGGVPLLTSVSAFSTLAHNMWFEIPKISCFLLLSGSVLLTRSLAGKFGHRICFDLTRVELRAPRRLLSNSSSSHSRV